MATTFELQPDDYANITFYAITPEGPESTSLNNYEYSLASLTFNEEQRVQVEYAQYQYREGGEAKRLRYPLVPVTFTGRVIGLGATAELRHQDLLAKSSALMRAVYNSDGYIRYKPDGLAAGVRDTYYHYIQSSPPKPAPGEYWCRPKASFSSTSYIDGIPTRSFSISLMTKPIATSDPTSPIQVLSATTLDNINDGTGDYVTITNATIDGDMPALTRIVAQPLTSDIGKLWLAKRTSGLANFTATYLTSAAQSPSAVWGTEVDAGRCGGSYYRCTPILNNVMYARRYTISNWQDHKGRAAVMVIARSNEAQAGDFYVYYRWPIANYPLTGEAKQLTQENAWEPLILGEIDLPETEISSQEDLDLYIDICVERKAGSGTLDLDCMKLLFTDEAAIQVSVPGTDGAETTHEFFLENFNEEIAHINTHADDKLAYIGNAYGDFLTLEPDSDNRIDVVWQRSYTYFYDDFTGHGDYWEGIAACESDEAWTGDVSFGSGYQVMEGDHNLEIGTATSSLTFASALDLSRFSTGDFLRFYTSYFGAGTIRLYSSDANYYEHSWNDGDDDSRYRYVKISDMSAVGSPSLGGITKVEVVGDGISATIDDIRIVSTDPNAATKPNGTGGAWRYFDAMWAVLDQGAVAKRFRAEVKNDGVALINQSLGTDVQVKVKVSGLGVSRSKVGIVFRSRFVATQDEADYYLFSTDQFAGSGNHGQYALTAYALGVPDVRATLDRTRDISGDLWMGVKTSGTNIQCFASAEETSLWEEANRIFNATNLTHLVGTRVGLYNRVYHTARTNDEAFDSIEVIGNSDLHVPTDEIQLSAYALFRTIYPFHEA